MAGQRRDLVAVDQHLHGLHGRDKWAVIDVLTDRLVETGQIPPGHRELVRDSLVAREKAMSTGMERSLLDKK